MEKKKPKTKTKIPLDLRVDEGGIPEVLLVAVHGKF